MSVAELSARVERLEEQQAAQQRQIAELSRVVLALQARRGPRDSADSALPAALARVFGGRIFTSKRAIKHAGLDSEFHRVLEDADVHTVRELGDLLKRLHGVPIGDYRIDLVKSSPKGCKWRLAVGQVGEMTNP